MGNGPNTDKRDFINKWISPELKSEIIAAKTLLDILQHPYMQTPIQDMELPDIFRSEIAALADDAVSTYDLLTKRYNLSGNTKQYLIDAANTKIKNHDNSAQLVMNHHDSIVRDSLDASHFRPSETLTLEDAINSAKSKLAALEIAMDKDLKSLHIVSITVPSSVDLVNNKETIIDAARDSLAANFTTKFNAYAAVQIKADISDLQGKSTPPTLLNRFKSWLSQMNDGVQLLESFSTASHANSVDTKTLEFAVRATEKGGHPYSEMRELIFKRVAADLSGLGLTEDVSNRLLPDYTAPQDGNQVKPHHWIEILSSQELN